MTRRKAAQKAVSEPYPKDRAICVRASPPPSRRSTASIIRQPVKYSIEAWPAR